MSLDPSLAALAVLGLVVLALTAFGAAALRFGVDSRPGIDERDRGPWLVPGAWRA
jgi:hypothetical protein